MSGSVNDICGVHASGGCFGGEGKDFRLFWQENAKKGAVFRASIIFGRNGSGKSTLAAKVAEAGDASNKACFFLDSEGQAVALSKSEAGRVRVFSESYVREKVLIEEDGLEAIVMLGTQATAKKRIEEIDKELIALGKARVELEAVKAKAATGPESLGKLEDKAKADAKNGGWADRRGRVEGTRQTLSPGRWANIAASKTERPRQELCAEFEELLAKYLKTENLSEAVMPGIASVDVTAYDEDALLELLNRELDEPVLSDREKRILGLVRGGRQALVEHARSVFADSETDFCPMCQQPISPEYREAIEASILRVLSKEVDEFKDALSRAQLGPIAIDLPSREKLASETVGQLERALGSANERIAAANALVGQRSNNLYAPLNVEALGILGALEVLNAAIRAANTEIDAMNAAARNRGAMRDRLVELNDQIAWVDSRWAMGRHDEAKRKLDEAVAKLEDAQRAERSLRAERGRREAEMNNAAIASEIINRHLANVYFDSGRFYLVADGGRYRIMSHGRPVAPRDVSTGERNVLGLCYFFSEGGKNRFEGTEDDDAQLIVLDDPVSSFDMENRVGICSLIHERARHILASNPESKFLVLTHDMGAATELAHTLDDINDELKGTASKAPVCRLELLREGTVGAQMKKGEYARLLGRAYAFAVSDEENPAESYVIGNVLRRVLEGYGTFNYGLGMERLTRDEDLRKRFGDLDCALSNLMYRLALNDESHMQERVNALNPSNDFERYSYAEKVAMAQCAVLALWLLDSDHVKKQLALAYGKLDPSELEANISQWKARFSPGQGK